MSRHRSTRDADEDAAPLIGGAGQVLRSDGSVQDARPMSADLSIQGMTCTSCSSAVTKALLALPGVSSASVSAIDGRAAVEYDAARIPDAAFQLVEAVEDCGFDAQLLSAKPRVAPGAHTSRTPAGKFDAMQPVRLRVGGMTCTSCSSAVERALSGVPGVKSVAVSVSTGVADITYDTGAGAGVAALVEAVEDCGFEAEEIPPARVDACSLTVDALTERAARSIEAALRAMDGVSEVRIALATQRIDVTMDASRVKVRGLVAAIRDAAGLSARLFSEQNALRDARDAEARKWKRLVVQAWVLAFPLFVIHMVLGNIPALHHALNTPLLRLPVGAWVGLALSTPVQWRVGWCFHAGAARAVAHGAADMNVLVSLGTTGAWVYSVAVCIERVVRGGDAPLQQFFETPALLIAFILLGKYLETIAKGRTSSAIEQLLSLAPPDATVVELDANGDVVSAEVVAVELLAPGDYLRVSPGGRVPVDGIMVYGASHVDESMVTGESVPVGKGPGDELTGGTINGDGAIVMKAMRVGQDSVLGQIVALVQKAQMTRAPVQAVADRIASMFVPVIIASSAVTLTAWLIAGYVGGGYSGEWLPEGVGRVGLAVMFAVTVVVVACPCALGLATPTAVMVATGVAAQHGILIKSGAALETTCKASVVVFDKTGTLTEGRPVVVDVLCGPDTGTNERLSGEDTLHVSAREELALLAASAEAGSEHHLARAVVQHASYVLAPGPGDAPRLLASRDFLALPGRGASSTVVLDARRTPRAWVRAQRGAAGGAERAVEVVVGNRALLSKRNIEVPAETEVWMEERERRAATCVMVAVGGALVGAFAIGDRVKREAGAVVRALQARGVRCHMVTGDNHRVADVVAAGLGLDHVVSEVRPADKADIVRGLQHDGEVVAMVGDGVNDSPALAAAEVGIAIGSGTDVAIEAADVVLMHSDLTDLLAAVDLSRTAMRRIWWNYVWATGYNVVLVPIAAGVLFPSFRVRMPPWVAGAAMAASSVSVVCSSLLLKLYKPPRREALYSSIEDRA
ncbi:unnamed protein product [Pedinophyceae sp. YPF-701]|nr:unnamed protein product [Pedinophyceae sp. YPF-701]